MLVLLHVLFSFQNEGKNINAFTANTKQYAVICMHLQLEENTVKTVVYFLTRKICDLYSKVVKHALHQFKIHFTP